MAIVLINETPTEVGCGADEIIRLREELAEEKRLLAEESQQYEDLRESYDRVCSEFAAAQARIDVLMLEYCPDEMTPEQMAEWAKYQRPLSPDEQAVIDAITKEQS